jgi:ABC-type nitrate/sulfonate/bicarbonate transport system permease component
MRAVRLLAITVVLGLVWEGGSRLDESVYLLVSRPTSVATALGTQLTTRRFYESVASSSIHVLGGIVLGTILGIMAGVALTTRGLLRDIVETCARLTRPIPPLACVPFGILAFGVSGTTAIFIVALGVFWTMAVGTEESIKAVPEEVIELATAFGYQPGLRRFLNVIVPSALPGMFAALRTSTGQGWTLVIAAEIAGVPGLGQCLWEASGVLASELVFAYLAVLAVLNRGSDGILAAFDRRYFAWRHS